MSDDNDPVDPPLGALSVRDQIEVPTPSANMELVERLRLLEDRLNSGEATADFRRSIANLSEAQEALAISLARLQGQTEQISRAQEDPQHRESRKQLVTRGLRAVVGSVGLLVLGNFLIGFFEIKAEKARQLFAAKTELYQNLLSEVGLMEDRARDLQWEIADTETAPASSTGLLNTQARIFVDRARDVSERLQASTYPPEWRNADSKEGFAVHRAWFELYALIACLENSVSETDSDSGSKAKRTTQEALKWAVERGTVTQGAADRLARSALDRPPCAGNFEPEVFQALRTSIVEASWRHLSEDPVSAMF